MAYTLLDSAYQLHGSSAEFASGKPGLLRRAGRAAKRAGGFALRNKGKIALAGAAGLGLAAVANRKGIAAGIGRTSERYSVAGMNERNSMRKQGWTAGRNDVGKNTFRPTKEAYSQADRRGRVNEAKKDLGRAVNKAKSFNPFRKK